MARELPKPNQTDKNKPTQEAISQRAHEIFVQRGCPEGRDMEHWLEAEAQLSDARPQEKATTSSPKTTKTGTRQATIRRG